MYANLTDVCQDSFFRFKLFDCPGQIDFFQAREEFGLTEKLRNAGAVIFVIDSQVLFPFHSNRIIIAIII